MSYETITTKQDVVAVDIPTMAEMSASDYREYLKYGLFNVDHHDVLRSGPAGYPLAVTKAQLAALISYLKELAPRVGSNP
jgi:hypothetical protein